MGRNFAMLKRALGGVIAACAALPGSTALAQSVHHFVDKDGIVHLTNVRGGSARHSRSAAMAARSASVPMVLLEAVIAESASLYKIPQALVKAVIATESNYNPLAVSERGAIGLMQLMPQTAKEMYVDDPFDPVQNIYGGTRYLRVLVNEFDGDLVKVVAAYNAGPDIVRRRPSRPVPEIPETQEYVRRVLMNYRAFRTADPASPATVVPETTERYNGTRAASDARG
jgi:hypothetical protein